MILPMKKVSIVLLNKEREQALVNLRKLGLVHLERLEGNSEKLSAFKEYSSNLIVAESVLGEIKLPKKQKKNCAELSYQKAIELDNTQTDFLYNLALVYEAKGEIEKIPDLVYEFRSSKPFILADKNT